MQNSNTHSSIFLGPTLFGATKLNKCNPYDNVSFLMGVNHL